MEFEESEGLRSVQLRARWRRVAASLAASSMVLGTASVELVTRAPDAAAAGGTAATAAGAATNAAARIERVVAVHDAARGEQHLVRELVVDERSGRADVLLATPSRAELVAITAGAGDPFLAVERGGGIAPAPAPTPQGFGGSRAGVERPRLSTRPRHPVRATMLGPGAPGVFESELRADGFAITPAIARWLERTSARGLHVTALRFDGTAPTGAPPAKGVPSLLVHLRFASPMPFLPYDEPEIEGRVGPRLTSVWLVSHTASTPVARRQVGPQDELVRPLREVARRDGVEAAALAHALGEASWSTLLPAGTTAWTVQRFDDQKRDRRGLGEVLFVPRSAKPLDDVAWERARPLARVLVDEGGPR